MNTLWIDKIKSLVEGDVDTSRKTLDEYSKDTSLFVVSPEMVVFPKTTKDVQNLVKFAQEEKSKGKNISLTARSAGTDMTGGPLGQSIILGFTKYMNKLKALGKDSAIVEPGMYYRDFEKETLKHGLLLPSYTASKDLCAVGGMASNNSGGEKNLMYGKTENYIRGLKVVLDDGSLEDFRPLDEKALKEKLQEESRAGEIYRGMHQLLEKNYEKIMKAKPNVSKNSSGYALWNIYDKKKGVFDMTKLLVGAQGTLGITTEITFGLVRPKKHRRMMTIFLRDTKKLGEIVNHVLKHKPESFESYDDHTFSLALRLFPQIAKRLKGNIITLAFRFLPEFFSIILGGVPKLVLLAEFSNDSESVAEAMVEKAADDIRENFDIQTRVLRSEKEAEKYWVMRRESFSLLRKNISGMRTAPFIDDFVVRPEYLPEFLPKLNALLAKYKIIYTIAGHVGDGNFHIIPLMDLTKPESKDIIKNLSKEVYSLVFEYGGVITGEHNDGIIRTPYLSIEYGDEIYDLFKKTKSIFDPNNIFNPGKKVGGTWQFAMDHINTTKPS